MSSQPIVDHVRLIKWTGDDGTIRTYSCPSWTDDEIEYEISFDRETWAAHCTCMDAICRKKEYVLLGGDNQDVCKHLRAFLRDVLPLERRAILGK